MSERVPGTIRVTGHILIAPVCANRELFLLSQIALSFREDLAAAIVLEVTLPRQPLEVPDPSAAPGDTLLQR